MNLRNYEAPGRRVTDHKINRPHQELRILLSSRRSTKVFVILDGTLLSMYRIAADHAVSL
jgi:hypothetical protein